ncbi:MAG: hypothetical protein ABIF71_15585 [Planctomycetota bacterium]
MESKLIKAKAEKNTHKGKLQNVVNPNLYREVFPYSSVCRITFDGVIEPMELPEEFWITDTTFRDGVMKDEEIYNIFNTTSILNRPPGIAITDKSGTAGIAFWINENVVKGRDYVVDKRAPGILKINDWVTAEYAASRTTTISNEELHAKVKEFMPELLEGEE